MPKAAPLARGDYLSAPPSLSLKQFVPPVGDQGDQGSCVGWATAYAARTMLKAKASGAGQQSLRDIVLSPSYVFNQINLPGCNGSYIPQALDLMRDQGVARLAEFPYSDTSCSAQPSDRVRASASDFRIKGFTRLWGRSGRNKHVAARRALANGNPVVIGMMVGDSFLAHQGSGTWRPSSQDLSYLNDLKYALDNGFLGGHAMTVVGYDDTRDGGAFEVVNSWSTGWGNRGFFWISYDMFNAFVFEGYEVLPLDPPPPPRVVDMGGAVRVLHISGDQIGARVDGAGYRLTRPLPSGTRFRVEATSDETGYLYVVGGDATGDYVALFPRGRDVAPYAQQNATLLLPGPTEQHFTRLNDTVGTDFYVLLFAQNELDPRSIADRMSRGSGDVQARLRQALGDRIVPDDEIALDSTGIGFEAASGDADVVPLILTIDHVAPSQDAGDQDAPLIVLTNPAPEAFDGDDAPIAVPSRLFTLEGMAQDESDIARLRIDGALSSQYSSRGPFRAEIELPEGPGPHPVTIETRDTAGNAATRTLLFTLTTY
ncbi:C1 family peptidase [Aestuariivita boseongensis]|uniref:C1 family peptidase n=1 Tax=Aestuariivita boseongensis TaxID=1470562 RepID=UPI0006814E2A|nr:C1 family peptidase [Aestuariivita boseongensis]